MMTPLSVEAFRHRDGYLVVETQDWIADRGDYAADLTGDLQDWMDEHERDQVDHSVVTGWIVDRTGEPPVGADGDGEMWCHHLFNLVHHLRDDLGFVLLSAQDLGELMIVVSDGLGLMSRSPKVYRSAVDLLDWADYTSAEGECARGHQWFIHDTEHLQTCESHDTGRYGVTEQVRVPFGDPERGYVACPECGKAVRFFCRL